MSDPKPIPTPSDDDETIVEVTTDPAAVPVAADYRLFVAGISTSGMIAYVDQTKPGGGFATTMSGLGTGVYKDLIATGTTLDGRIAILVADKTTSDVIYISEQFGQAGPTDRWNAPENLGLPAGVKDVGSLALARGVNGLDNVFMSTTENTKSAIWWKYRNPQTLVTKTVEVTPPGASAPIKVTVQEYEPPAQPWSDWIDISGSLEGYLSGMKATNNADGRIVLTGIYFNGFPWVNQQTSADPSKAETWTDWSMPGPGSDETVGDLTPVLDSEGRVSIFASTNNGLLRSRQPLPGGEGWSAWTSPGVVNDNVMNHAVAMTANGGLYAALLNFAPPGEKTLLYGIMETDTSFAQWTAWQRIGMIDKADGIAMDIGADGRLALFVFNKSLGKLYTITQPAENSTEWQYFWTEIADALTCFSVAQDLTP